MSSLSITDRLQLENYLGMSSGFVLNFSDRTFRDFVFDVAGVDIHADEYSANGTSKANKLRTFWKIEPDYVVGRLILALIDYDVVNRSNDSERSAKAEKCRQIAASIIAGSPNLGAIKEHARVLDANHLTEQIRRLEASVQTDPSLAIGTAKEIIETVCKTILSDRGKTLPGTPDVSTLTKETLKALKLVPDGIPDSARGADVIKRVLSNLGAIGNGLAELRGLYGTGHGKHGRTSGLTSRHAKLAVGAATTLAVFLFETHNETK
jgi:hypothetical protein